MAPIGFGVIGAGIVGGAWHARVFSSLPHTKLVAVCDLDETRAAGVAQQYGAEAVYTDYCALLDNPAVQAVSIATPDFAHREIAVACAEAGKHILVEKPLATTVEDAEAILTAAQKAGVKLMVDFHNRCNPAFVSAKQSIQNGEVGRPAYIYARLSNTIFVATQMLGWASKSSPLWFLASHMMDMARWLLEDEPKRVYAVSRAGVLAALGVDTQDFYTAIVEFAGGAVVTLENAWILPMTEPNVFNLKFEILGSSGSIYVNTSDNRAVETFTAGRATIPDILGMLPVGPERIGGFVLEAVARFADAVAYDRPVLASGADGLVNTRVLAAIIDSARTGQSIDL